MTKHTDYINIEDANLDIEQGQYWELHPNDTIDADLYNDEGEHIKSWELTDHAAFTYIEQIDEDKYLLHGTQLGESFSGSEANIDGDIRIRLVDAR